MPTKARRIKEIRRGAPTLSENENRLIRREIRIGDFDYVELPHSGKGLRLSVTLVTFEYQPGVEEPISVMGMTTKGCLIIRDENNGTLRFRPTISNGRYGKTFPLLVVTPNMADEIINLASKTRWIKRVGEGAIARKFMSDPSLRDYEQSLSSEA